MKPYIIPGWLTPSLRIRADAVKHCANLSDADIARIADHTRIAHEGNERIYKERQDAWRRTYMDAVNAYGESHEITRKIRRTAVEPPPEVLALLDKYVAEIRKAQIAKARRERANANARWRRRMKALETSDNDYWPLDDHNHYPWPGEEDYR